VVTCSPMFFRSTFVFLLFAAFAIPTATAQADKVKELRDIMVPARDGVKLGTNVFLPAKDGSHCPRAVSRDCRETPYNKDGVGRLSRRVLRERGYAVVIQDVRGATIQRGAGLATATMAADGSDLLKWIGEQPWSNGRSEPWAPHMGCHPACNGDCQRTEPGRHVPVDAMKQHRPLWNPAQRAHSNCDG